MTPKKITHAEKWCQVEYSTLCPWSVRNRWLLLQDGGGFYALHTGDGEYVRQTLLGHNQEPRWDSENPDLFYYLTGNTIQSYNAVSFRSTMIQIFSEYVLFAAGERNGVQGLGEGDIENDVWALAGMRPDGKRDVFLYNVKQRRKSKVLTLEPQDAPPTYNKSGRIHGLDNVYCTPSGNCQIGWYASGKDRFQGVELYDGDMQFIRQLAPVMSHNDVARYQGQDILIWGSSADPEINKNALFAIDNMSGMRRQLYEMPWAYAYHVSACSQDFAILSTYAPDNSLPSQVLKLKLDGSGVELICETGSIMPTDLYSATPRASVSRDGSRVVFNSNSGITNRGVNYVDVFFVMLGSAEIPTIPTEIPTQIPQKPEPIAVQPDLSTDLKNLRAFLATREEHIRTLEGQVETLTRSLTDLMKEVAEKPTPAPLTNGALAEALKTITTLRAELLAEEHESGLQHVRADEAAFRLAEALKQVELLVTALAAVHPIDPTVWQKIDFLSPVNQAWRRWGHIILPNGRLQMNDVDGQNWSPVSDEVGDKYLLECVKGGPQAEYDMYEAGTNQK